MTSSWHWQSYWKFGIKDRVLSLTPRDLSLVDRYNHPGLPRRLSDKESACQCSRCGLVPWVAKISWSRKWQRTPVFLSGKFHGQRSLAGYYSRGCKRLRHNWTTEQQKQSSNQVEGQLIKLSCNPYFSILIAWNFLSFITAKCIEKNLTTPAIFFLTRLSVNSNQVKRNSLPAYFQFNAFLLMPCKPWL